MKLGVYFAICAYKKMGGTEADLKNGFYVIENHGDGFGYKTVYGQCEVGFLDRIALPKDRRAYASELLKMIIMNDLPVVLINEYNSLTEALT